jgi:glycerol-3-phosphate dehydrogenase (NAD+)
VKQHIHPSTPILCLAKGLEVGTCEMMSEVIPAGLGRDQPLAVLSGPTFAVELMQGLPTAIVAASTDEALAWRVQRLFGSSCLRVNTSTDVVGVEMSGALKNVLAIAAGIVEGLNLGNNAMAALVAQGCAEIRWLAGKMGAKPETLSGLSGTGDIMLTCFVNLSRNRTVGVRLGRGESLEQILGSMTQVAEGVATAGAVMTLARRYKVSLPVLTAVARILEDNLDPATAVEEIMNLPQIPEV